jgi:hypothetical protein
LTVNFILQGSQRRAWNTKIKFVLRGNHIKSPSKNIASIYFQKKREKMMMKNLKIVCVSYTSTSFHFTLSLSLAHLLTPLTQINIYTFCGNKASFIAWHLHNNFLYIKTERRERECGRKKTLVVADDIALVKCR